MNTKRLISLLPGWLRGPLRGIRARVFDVHACKSFSQEGEDMILKRIFEGKERGFYVDVGAHHPRRFSNTHFFYCKGWTGINIEPNADAIAAFRKERPKDINLQMGISEQEGSLTYHQFNDPALNSFSGALSDHRIKTTPYKLVGTTDVKVTRLEAILRQHLPEDTAIDFLTIDVEGLDMSVLQSNDWRAFRPAYVLIESLGSTLGEAMEGEEARFMKEHGYELFAKTVNTLIFRRTCEELSTSAQA